jgi:hypothetical protein
MTSVKLKHGAVTYTVPCIKVQAEARRAVSVKPNANPDDIVEAQTQGFENPVYTIQGVYFTGNARTGETVLTQKALLGMLKQNNTGSGDLKLVVQYGDSDYLYSWDAVSSEIPVVMKAFTFPLDTTDSKNSYMPVGNITLVETK